MCVCMLWWCVYVLYVRSIVWGVCMLRWCVLCGVCEEYCVKSMCEVVCVYMGCVCMLRWCVCV